MKPASISRADDRVGGRVLRLADGRRLGFAEYGAGSGQPLLFFHGTPGRPPGGGLRAPQRAAAERAPDRAGTTGLRALGLPGRAPHPGMAGRRGGARRRARSRALCGRRRLGRGSLRAGLRLAAAGAHPRGRGGERHDPARGSAAEAASGPRPPPEPRRAAQAPLAVAWHARARRARRAALARAHARPDRGAGARGRRGDPARGPRCARS